MIGAPAANFEYISLFSRVDSMNSIAGKAKYSTDPVHRGHQLTNRISKRPGRIARF
jgi:hypothetical protein